MLDPKVIEDPYPFYRRLHNHAPVWQVPGTEVFVVSSFARLAEAAGRVEDFSSNMPCLLYREENGLPSRLPFGDSGIPALATADPPIHTLHRSTVFPNFVAKRMALLEPEILDLATGCVERALDKRNVDFMAEVGNVVPITVISRLIGFRNSDLDRLLRAAFDSTELVGATLSRERLIELITRSNDLGSWIVDQLAIAAKRARRGHPETPSDGAWRPGRSVPLPASSSCRPYWPPEVNPPRA
jgi:cytochrome P450